MRDQLARQVERVPACLLRCYPHEWSLLVGAPGGGVDRAKAAWRYAGRFQREPRQEEIEKLLAAEITKARDEGIKRSPGPEA